MKKTLLFLIIISCSPYQEIVDSGLDLSSQNLKSFPIKYLKQKEKIEKLGLNNNLFTGFPTEILHFENLRTLNLANNDIQNIDENINKLKKLKIIDLRGTKVRSLPVGIKELDKLELLLMMDISITDEEKSNIKCMLPKKCEVIFSKKYREYPPYECNNNPTAGPSVSN